MKRLALLLPLLALATGCASGSAATALPSFSRRVALDDVGYKVKLAPGWRIEYGLSVPNDRGGMDWSVLVYEESAPNANRLLGDRLRGCLVDPARVSTNEVRLLPVLGVPWILRLSLEGVGVADDGTVRGEIAMDFLPAADKAVLPDGYAATLLGADGEPVHGPCFLPCVDHADGMVVSCCVPPRHEFLHRKRDGAEEWLHAVWRTGERGVPVFCVWRVSARGRRSRRLREEDWLSVPLSGPLPIRVDLPWSDEAFSVDRATQDAVPVKTIFGYHPEGIPSIAIGLPSRLRGDEPACVATLSWSGKPPKPIEEGGPPLWHDEEGGGDRTVENIRVVPCVDGLHFERTVSSDLEREGPSYTAWRTFPYETLPVDVPVPGRPDRSIRLEKNPSAPGLVLAAPAPHAESEGAKEPAP